MAMSICMRMLVWLEQPTQAQCTNYDCCAISAVCCLLSGHVSLEHKYRPSFPAGTTVMTSMSSPTHDDVVVDEPVSETSWKEYTFPGQKFIEVKLHYLCRTDSWHPHASPLTPWSTQSPMMMALVPGLVMRWIHQVQPVPGLKLCCCILLHHYVAKNYVAEWKYKALWVLLQWDKMKFTNECTTSVRHAWM